MTATANPFVQACSLLFVPGVQPERFVKALDSGAGGVIIDWEDAVAPDQKIMVREQTLRAIAKLPVAARHRLAVRVNALDTPWHAGDVTALRQSAAVRTMVLPKAERAADLVQIAAALGPGGQILPLVESVAGLYAVRELAAARGVLRLLFGHLDFQADAGLACGPDEQELAPVRLQIVLASRAAGLPAPVDSITASIDDLARVGHDAARALRGGFGGKLCIHPAQVQAVHAAFLPSAEQLDWAQRVVAAHATHGGGALALDGHMVDAPVVNLAKRTLQRAQALNRQNVDGVSD